MTQLIVVFILLAPRQSAIVFDQKTSKLFELVIVVVAALLGGIVGSVITVSFR